MSKRKGVSQDACEMLPELPTEVWAHIWKLVDDRAEIWKASYVCKYWRSTATKYLRDHATPRQREELNTRALQAWACHNLTFMDASYKEKQKRLIHNFGLMGADMDFCKILLSVVETRRKDYTDDAWNTYLCVSIAHGTLDYPRDF